MPGARVFDMPPDGTDSPGDEEGEPDPRKDGAFDQDEEDELVPHRSVVDRLRHVFQLGGRFHRNEEDDDDDG